MSYWSFQKLNISKPEIFMWRENIVSIKCWQPAHTILVYNNLILRQNTLFSNFFWVFEVSRCEVNFQTPARIKVGRILAPRKYALRNSRTEMFLRSQIFHAANIPCGEFLTGRNFLLQNYPQWIHRLQNFFVCGKTTDHELNTNSILATYYFYICRRLLYKFGCHLFISYYYY